MFMLADVNFLLADFDFCCCSCYCYLSSKELDAVFFFILSYLLKFTVDESAPDLTTVHSAIFFPVSTTFSPRQLQMCIDLGQT